MFAHNYLPQLVECRVSGASDKLDANAKRAEDGKTLILEVVNSADTAVAAEIRLAGFVPSQAEAVVSELCGPLNAVNTAGKRDTLVPQRRRWSHGIQGGNARYTFPPHSLTMLRFE